MNGERPQRFPFIKEGSKSVDPRLMGVKGANERQKKMNRLLSMKYNQRWAESAGRCVYTDRPLIAPRWRGCVCRRVGMQPTSVQRY